MKQNNNMKKKTAVITSIILGAFLVAGGAFYFLHENNVKQEAVAEAPVAAKQETSKKDADIKRNSAETKSSEAETQDASVTQAAETTDTTAQTELPQQTVEATAAIENAAQAPKATPSKSSAAKTNTSQQKVASQKATSASQKSQIASQPAPTVQPASQPANTSSQDSSDTSGKRELYLPQGHYEKRVVKPAYTAYDVQAFEEPVMQSFCVFYDYNGNEIKTFTREESDPYTDAGGQYHDPLTEYGLYVVRNHLGGGNWMVEQHQVDTIHHDAQSNLTQEQFDAYLATLKNQSGLVYSKGTVPAETEEVFVPNN